MRPEVKDLEGDRGEGALQLNDVVGVVGVTGQKMTKSLKMSNV